MSDPIERQDAIEHLKKRLYETEFNSNAEYPYYQEIADNRVDVWMNEVPSAQQWTPCSERLPEGNLYVLVTYKYQYGLMDLGITWYSERENKWCDVRPIIAWMPLPEPHREEQND